MQNPINFSVLTPESYKQQDPNIIVYGFANTRYGKCLIGLFESKICYLAFCDSNKEDKIVDELKTDWKYSKFERNDDIINPVMDSIFKSKKVDVLLSGTDFQVEVWKKLCEVKSGKTATYSDIAENIGNPKAIRPVASAVARNKVALLIPCHRILSKSAEKFKYRWGASVKKAILEYESNN